MNIKEIRKNFIIGIIGVIIGAIIVGGPALRKISCLESDLESEMSKSSKLEEHILELTTQKKTEITYSELINKLQAIDELATYEKTYMNILTRSDTRGVPILDGLTKNSVEISYSGRIKVGYNVKDIKPEVDQERRIIKIKLPEPNILDNYIIHDSLQYKEKNNILNPINGTDTNAYLVEIEKQEQDEAIDEGIFEKAEDHVKLVIENALAVYPDYEIIFYN